MPSESSDSAAVRLPPPLPYLVAVVAAWALDAFVIPLPLSLSTAFRIVGAAVFILLGMGAVASAGYFFKKNDQDPNPWKPTTEIVSSGIYRYTRNPMYFGLALIQIGLAFAMANLWVMVFLPLALAAVYAIAIVPEEAYLESKFGETYLDYKRSVRRWI